MSKSIKSSPNSGELQLNMFEKSWSFINGYGLRYKISTAGNVLRLHKGKYISKAIQLAKRGYYVTDLIVAGKRKNCKIHRLVASNFIPNPENKREVNHIDGNKLNNDVANLEWATQQENISHASAMGLLRVGSDNYFNKYDVSKVYMARYLYASGVYSMPKIGEMLGTSRRFPQQVIHGESWRHINYWPGLPYKKDRVIPKKSKYFIPSD